MPLHDKRIEVSDLKTKVPEYETFWRNQKELDNLQLSIILLTNRDLTAPGKEPSKSFQSGIGGIIWRENASLYSANPTIVFTVPEDDPDLLDFVNNKAEPWVNAAIKRSQEAERVFNRKPPDMLGIGRAWSFCAPVPGKWASKEILDLISESEKETDESELKRIKREISLMRRDNWPFRYRYVDPRTCFSMFGGDERLPLVLEHRTMTAEEVRTEYGDDVISSTEKGTSIEVYPYANHFESGIYIASGDGQIVKRFEHGLDKSPYGLMEAKLLPPNEKNWRWGGMLFHALNLIPGFDQLLTDYMAYVHDYTYSPIGIFYDPEAYDDDARTAGRPKHVEMKPGEQIAFWKGEEVKPLFNPQMNDQQYLILQELKQLIYTNLISDTARGDPKSGTSNNQFVTALQTVRQQAEPYMQAIEDDYRDLAITHLRGVASLSKDMDDPDPVEIISGFKGKGFIGMKPKDTIGIEPMMQAVMSRASLTDQQISANLSESLIRLGVSREQVLEEVMGYPQPDRVIERGRQSQMKQVLFESEKNAILALSGEMFNTLTPAEEAELLELRSEGSSPGVEQAIQGLFQDTPGPERQARSNERRRGSVQEAQRV